MRSFSLDAEKQQHQGVSLSRRDGLQRRLHPSRVLLTSFRRIKPLASKLVSRRLDVVGLAVMLHAERTPTSVWWTGGGEAIRNVKRAVSAHCIAEA